MLFPRLAAGRLCRIIRRSLRDNPTEWSLYSTGWLRPDTSGLYVHKQGWISRTDHLYDVEAQYWLSPSRWLLARAVKSRMISLTQQKFLSLGSV